MPLHQRPLHLPERIYIKIQADAAPEDVLNGLMTLAPEFQTRQTSN